MIAFVFVGLPLFLAQNPPTALQIQRGVSPWFQGACRVQPVSEVPMNWNFRCGTAKAMAGALEVSLWTFDDGTIREMIEIFQKIAGELRLMGDPQGPANQPLFRWLASEERLPSGRLTFFSIFPNLPGRFVVIDRQSRQMLVVRYVAKDPILQMQPADFAAFDALFEQLHNAGMSIEKRVWRY